MGASCCKPNVSSVAEPLAKAATMSPAPVSPASPPLKPTVSVTNDSATAPEVKAEVEGAYQTNETSQAPSNASNRIHPGPTDEAPAPPGGVAPPPIPRPAPMSEVAGSKEGQAAPQKKSEVQGPQEAGGADGHNGAGSNRPQSSGVLAPTETPSNILLKISPSSGPVAAPRHMGEEPGAEEEAGHQQQQEKQKPVAEKLVVEGEVGGAVVGGGGESSNGGVDGGGSRGIPPRGGGGGKKAAVVDDDGVGRGDVSEGGGGAEGGDAEGDEARKREKAPGDAVATGGFGEDFAVPGPAEISPPRAGGSDEEQVVRPEPSGGGGGSWRASRNPSRVSSMAGSPPGGGGGEGARDSVRDAIRSQFLDEGRLASVEGTVMIEDVADDEPPPALEWDGLLQRQFEVEHMIRESLADEASIQKVESSVLGLLRFQKQLTQVSQALGLTQTGLLFQQLISRLEGSEEHSLVTGLVDLDRIQDSAEPLVEQCRILRSLVRIKVQDSADLAAASGTLSEARAFFHSLGVHAERKGVSRYDVLEELRKF